MGARVETEELEERKGGLGIKGEDLDERGLITMPGLSHLHEMGVSGRLIHEAYVTVPCLDELSSILLEREREREFLEVKMVVLKYYINVRNVDSNCFRCGVLELHDLLES